MLLKTNGKKVKVGDLVAYRFFGGEWDRSKKETDWKENDYPFFLFATIADIRKAGDVPHTGDPEDRVKIEWSDEEHTNEDNPKWYWVNPKNLIFLMKKGDLNRKLK